MNGIIAIDKPEGYTSFDIIAKIRRKFGQKKIGHMGTLDPMATGVLPILLGETAKFQVFAPDTDKRYTAEIKFGITTDTLDITGKILTETKSYVTEEEIKKVLDNFRGEISQVPPMFSAIKKNGQKLYDLARKGVIIEREPRQINIKSLEIINFSEKNQILKIDVLCSKGTYIRSLCADIGEKLGCGATMTHLRRTLSNGFSESASVPLETLLDSSLEEIQEKYISPTEYLFKNEKSVEITPAQAQRFKNGGSLLLSRLSIKKPCVNNEIFKIYDNKKFIGIGKICKESEELKFLKCLIFDAK